MSRTLPGEQQFHLVMPRVSKRENCDSARAGQCGWPDSIRLGSLEVRIRRLGIEGLGRYRQNLHGSHGNPQLGLRSDSGGGPERRWLAAGVQGLAPYWFDVDVTAYLGEGGRTALRLSADYDILLTQKLILQPRVEASLYGQEDKEREIGSGLSSGSVGLRLRYELSRQIAPYIGVEWKGKYGATADLARSAGAPTEESQWVAGVRFWF